MKRSTKMMFAASALGVVAATGCTPRQIETWKIRTGRAPAVVTVEEFGKVPDITPPQRLDVHMHMIVPTPWEEAAATVRCDHMGGQVKLVNKGGGDVEEYCIGADY